MKKIINSKRKASLTLAAGFFFFLAVALAFTVQFALAAPGGTVLTPVQPFELPIEIEIELGPASLKQAPLWKELVQLLDNPYEPVVRRPGFGVVMPELNIWPLGYNFLTGQPLRLRTNDGEVSWDNPGPMFDPDEVVAVDEFNVPIELRTVIGELVAEDAVFEFDGVEYTIPNGNLVVRNPETNPDLDDTPDLPDPRLPPDGTVVAVPAFFGGMLHEYDPEEGEYEEVITLEKPVNETDFIADRAAAEVLGKALFWDMQVGSDGVQACGSCHFHAGVDNRTRNQLNPNHLNGDNTLQARGRNESVRARDFPFHKLLDPNIPGEPLLNPDNAFSDANDVMSSMGVIFRGFVDIPIPGPKAFIVSKDPNMPNVLKPDIARRSADPLGRVFRRVRRVEPRNTPTFHGAAFNFDNFWDGRARFHFNGGSVFGQADPFFHTFIDDDGVLEGTANGHILDELIETDPDVAEQPIRIKFSSLASQAVGPPLSNFEMSFDGRNWAKIGKKLLQPGVTPLANQLVDPNDSALGPYSGQRSTVGGPVDRPGRPGLNISYPELIQTAFLPEFWENDTQHLRGTAVPLEGFNRLDPDPAGPDPFDGYQLAIADGPADPTNTNEFTQMEANFSLFFGLAVQAYESLTIPDDTLFDKFMDANPLANNGIGEPGDQAVLIPTLIPGLVGPLTLIPDDPLTPEYDGFGPDEIFGFDIFAGGNLTAALSEEQAVDPVSGVNRNPNGFGSNPFTRTARCMLCHLGPEQTDHSINVAHGLLKGDAEFEYPTPPTVIDPFGTEVPAPEPPGPIAAVGGLILAEEVEETAQDAVEVEPRSFAMVDILVDDPNTPWLDESAFDDRIVAQAGFFAFGDQGIYNVGVRPISEDISRGGSDPFGWPLSLAALTLKNIGGADFEPPDNPSDPPALMQNFDPEVDLAGGLFEETGDETFFPGTTHTLQSINPGFERSPITPMLPEYLSPWAHGLPAGELHPQIDEMAGLAPNTRTIPNGGPAIEFTENMFGADLHTGVYDPDAFGAGAPNFGWGPRAANSQSGVTGNHKYPLHGTWPMANRVLRDGAFKAPPLRNVELTGPYFHTGSYLTLRQVVDFYIRGGDFPITNAEGRDPHMLDVANQAFGFGTTRSQSNGGPIPDIPFADALPDTPYQYDPMPDTDHPLTPEPATSTVEQAKDVLVRYLLSLTDSRVKYERAPFDHPEIFVPVDGRAPDNTEGRAALLADRRFIVVPAVGAAGRFDANGNPDPLSNFLDVKSVRDPNGPDHFDSFTGINLVPTKDTPGVLKRIVRRIERFERLLDRETARANPRPNVIARYRKALANSEEELTVGINVANVKNTVKAVHLVRRINRYEATLAKEQARANPRQSKIDKYQQAILDNQADLDALLV